MCPFLTDAFSNVYGTMSVSVLTSPMEICHLVNILTGRSVAWMCPYSLINLTLKAKKCIFIYENWLIVAIIYHSSQVANRRGVLVSGVGEGRGSGLN